MNIREAYKVALQGFKDKRGQVSFGNITGAAVAIGVLIVVVTVFAILVTDLGSDQGANTAARNVTDNGLDFFQNLTSQVGLLGTILILVLIVVIIISAFAFRRQGRGGL